MDPIKLQQDLRNNQEDIQNYMRDLRNWTDQIKKKDRELTSQSKHDKSTENAQSKGSGDSKKPNRSEGSLTPGGIERHQKKMAEKREPSEEVLRLKEAGNECLKNREYEKAIEHYSTAIKLDPNYHILLANRGMAYLKLNSYEEAEIDCGKAVALDPGYIKGYLRRGTARLELGKLELAKNDYGKVLQLEPHNPQAKMSMERIKLEEAKQARLKTTKRKGDVTSPGDMGTKTPRPAFGEAPSFEKPAYLRSKTLLRKVPVVQVGNDDELNDFINGQCSSHTEATENRHETERLSPVNCSVVQNAADEVPESEEKRHVSSTKDDEKATEGAPAMTPGATVAQPSQAVTATAATVPAAPRSSYEFVRDWKLLRAHGELRGHYLRQIPPDNYAAIFKQALEESTLVEILRVAETLPAREIGAHLRGLSRVQRVDVLVMFMGTEDKKLLRSLVSKCEEDGCDMSDVKKRVGI